MRKIFKDNIKVIITIIICGIIFTSVTAYAMTQYYAKDIVFEPNQSNKEQGWNPGNVDEALNDLYTGLLNRSENVNVSVFWDASGIENTNIKNTWIVENNCIYVISIHSGRGYNYGSHVHNVSKNGTKLTPTTSQWHSDWSWGETYIVDAKVGDEIYVNANTTNSYGDEYISVTEIR